MENERKGSRKYPLLICQTCQIWTCMAANGLVIIDVVTADRRYVHDFHHVHQKLKTGRLTNMQ